MVSQPAAGPSHRRKNKRDAPPRIRSSKVKKLSENQRIEALERQAMEFASTSLLTEVLDLIILSKVGNT